MKKIIIVLFLLSFLLISCASESDLIGFLMNKYETTKVRKIPDETNKFLIRKDDGSIIYVLISGTGNRIDIHSESLIFPPEKE